MQGMHSQVVRLLFQVNGLANGALTRVQGKASSFQDRPTIQQAPMCQAFSNRSSLEAKAGMEATLSLVTAPLVMANAQRLFWTNTAIPSSLRLQVTSAGLNTMASKTAHKGRWVR